MKPFAEIHARAVARHGEAALASYLPVPKTAAELRAVSDDRYLSAMTARVFAAGFQWRVIEAKWPGFESAFLGFDPAAVAAFGAEEVAALCADERIVRNRSKILATVANARFVHDVAGERGSFGAYLADWPATDTVGLWQDLEDRGERLGGDTGAWFLRQVGKDTFRFSDDVVAALIDAGVVTKAPSGKRDRAAAQQAFNTWSEESGLAMCQLSAVLSRSIGAVREGYGRPA